MMVETENCDRIPSTSAHLLQNKQSLTQVNISATTGMAPARSLLSASRFSSIWQPSPPASNKMSCSASLDHIRSQRSVDHLLHMCLRVDCCGCHLRSFKRSEPLRLGKNSIQRSNKALHEICVKSAAKVPSPLMSAYKHKCSSQYCLVEGFHLDDGAPLCFPTLAA